jgi:hypothetical protein
MSTHTPTEKDNAENQAVSPDTSVAAPKKSAFVPQSRVEKFGAWVHRHNAQFTKEPLSYMGYQFVRGTLASVPYGLGMALMHHGMQVGNYHGQKLGYTAEGLAAIADKNIGFKGAGNNKAFFQSGNKARLGRNMARIANSPFNISAQIALGFAFYGLLMQAGKEVRDDVINPENTLEETIEKTKKLPKEYWTSIKEHFPAHIHSTPFAAVALGFIGSHVSNPQPLVRLTLENGKKENIAQVAKRQWGSGARLAQHAAIWALAYSAYGGIKSRFMKQYNESNPDAYSHHPAKDTPQTQEAPDDKSPEAQEPAAKHGPWITELTPNGTFGSVVLKEFVPTAVAATVYAASKRVTWPMFGGPMRPVTEQIMKGGAAGHATHIAKNWWREGGAVAAGMWTYWVANDAIGKKISEWRGEKNPKPALMANKGEVPRSQIDQLSAELQEKIAEKAAQSGVAL